MHTQKQIDKEAYQICCAIDGYGFGYYGGSTTVTLAPSTGDPLRDYLNTYRKFSDAWQSTVTGVLTRKLLEPAIFSGFQPDPEGFGFVKGLKNKISRAVKKVTPKFVQKAVNKVVNYAPVKFISKKAKQFATWAEKATRHPAFTAVVGAILNSVPGGQAAGIAFLALQAARASLSKLASGDPALMAQGGAELAMIANQASGGDAVSQDVMKWVNAVKDAGQGNIKTGLNLVQNQVVSQFPKDTIPPEIMKLASNPQNALSYVAKDVAKLAPSLPIPQPQIQNLAQKFAHLL